MRTQAGRNIVDQLLDAPRDDTCERSPLNVMTSHDDRAAAYLERDTSLAQRWCSWHLSQIARAFRTTTPDATFDVSRAAAGAGRARQVLAPGRLAIVSIPAQHNMTAHFVSVRTHLFDSAAHGVTLAQFDARSDDTRQPIFCRSLRRLDFCEDRIFLRGQAEQLFDDDDEERRLGCGPAR